MATNENCILIRRLIKAGKVRKLDNWKAGNLENLLMKKKKKILNPKEIILLL